MKARITLLFIFTLISFLAFSQGTLNFNTPGSNGFNVPAGSTLTVQIWGGGGGGGGQNGNNQEGGGGGGGGYSTDVFNNQIGGNVTFTVGGGGSGGTNVPTAGSQGGTTTFKTLNAVGGEGGPANNGGTAANGGTASGGTNTSGGNGVVGNGSSPTSTTGAGGNGGASGNSGNGRTTNGAGNTGTAPGGGGSGGLRNGGPTNTAGGNGANGRVTIAYTCPSYNVIDNVTVTVPPTGNGTPATVEIQSALVEGTYTVAYSLSAPATPGTGSSIISINSSGVGTFTTANISNYNSSTTITLNSLSSGTAPNNCTTSPLANGSAPLPVELVSIKVTKVGEKASITWSTASEINNEKFIVERSADGKTFKAIGEKAGNGTTLGRQTYSFTDENPLNGINYYRLKQMDFDGGFEYSPVQSVVMRKDGEIAVYPTVTQGELQIALPEAASETTTINIFSMNGALVSKQVQEGTGVLTLTLPSEMIAGQYIVEVINGNISKRTQIFKQ